MDQESLMTQVRKKVSQMKPGTVFTARDFWEISDSPAIRQSLKRLTGSGTIRRIAHGMYDKPVYSRLLGEFEEADIYNAAHALARINNWTIAPSGNIALNLLGLSTQVSTKWSFVSDGPYRTYTVGSSTIEFKHRANREITRMSEMTLLVIQALKALGKERVTDLLLAKIQEKLTCSEKKKLLIEAKTASSWINKAIQKICEEVQCSG